jgi:hypothetical protein
MQLLEPLLTPREFAINEQFTFKLILLELIGILFGITVEGHSIPFQLKPLRHLQVPFSWLTPSLLVTKLQLR